MKALRNNQNAFSLPELHVVLVIFGILVLVTLSNLIPLISRAKATEAQFREQQAVLQGASSTDMECQQYLPFRRIIRLMTLLLRERKEPPSVRYLEA